jgi:cytochrome P450
MSVHEEIPVDNIDFDHTDAEYIKAPVPTYHALHARCPVARSSKFGGFWVLSRYEDVSQAARDTKTFSSAQGISIPVFGTPIPLVPIEADPPQHTDFRRTLQREFSSRRMAAIEGSIRELAGELIDGFIARGSADLATELAMPLPPIILAKLMGFPREDWESFRTSTEKLIETSRVGDDEGNMQAAMAFGGKLMEIMADRREHPQDDMLTRIVHSEVEGRPVTEVEALGLIWVTVIAGHETTVGGIGSLLMHVAKDEALRERLLGDPELIPKAVQEAVRMEAPIQGSARTVTQDVCVRDQWFREGEKVWLLFAAGNRDEARFANPDRFDLDRQPNPHLGFGDGVHRCVGAPLAQVEMRVVLEEVLKRIPDYRITDWDAITFGGTQSRTVSHLPAAWG